MSTFLKLNICYIKAFERIEKWYTYKITYKSRKRTRKKVVLKRCNVWTLMSFICHYFSESSTAVINHSVPLCIVCIVFVCVCVFLCGVCVCVLYHNEILYISELDGGSTVYEVYQGNLLSYCSISNEYQWRRNCIKRCKTLPILNASQVVRTRKHWSRLC